jgi:MFS family permease
MNSSTVVQTYIARVRAFHPNARLYLVSALLTGAALGVYRLLFNFYMLSLGYDERLLGQLITTTSMTALLVALPMGYLSDMIGRKWSLILGGASVVAAILTMVLLPSIPMFFAMNMLMGAGQSLSAVTMSPFLMENSGIQERTYLFSLSVGLQTAAGAVGNWVGGYLPTWVAQARDVSPTSSVAYAGALSLIALGAAIALVPLFWLTTPNLRRSQRAIFTPFQYASQHPMELSKLILPMLLISLGAGLIMPFMNVFFRNVHFVSDPVIGTLFAWGSLAMGIGILLAPPLADRLGKVQLVVITQGLSIPFLAIMGYSPWFWMSATAYYIRLTLMNMGGPVYQAFVMERVEEESRATVASLVSMANNFGWAFSPTISGLLQVKYGFNPVFMMTITLYSIAVFLYWYFFWPRKTAEISPATLSG